MARIKNYSLVRDTRITILMFIDKEHGTMFEIGEWIVHSISRFGIHHKSGIVLEAHLPINGDAGWYKILMDNGNEFIDYHYVFELDVQRTREERLKELGI